MLHDRSEKEDAMKKVSRKRDDLFIGIAFGEDQEFSTAQEALKVLGQNIEDTFTAIAFAEAGEFEAAPGSISKDGKKPGHRSRHTETRVINLCAGRA